MAVTKTVNIPPILQKTVNFFPTAQFFWSKQQKKSYSWHLGNTGTYFLAHYSLQFTENK
jgi:hypothetical protein